MTYEPPTVTELGSLRDLTLQKSNKVGTVHDGYSATTPLVGSVVPAP
jgi:hypothetical protein